VKKWQMKKWQAKKWQISCHFFCLPLFDKKRFTYGNLGLLLRKWPEKIGFSHFEVQTINSLKRLCSDFTNRVGTLEL
jgi:hypothetical protein